MTAPVEPVPAPAPYSFTVAGRRVEVPQFRRRARRLFELIVTADAAAVRAMLPQGISPVLSRPGRAWVKVLAADTELLLGDLPPVRYGEVRVSACVTQGERSLPPGTALPGILAGTAAPAFGAGLFDLVNVVTNRFVHGYYAVIGLRPMVGTVRWEERAYLDRVMCSVDGIAALDLALRTMGRVAPRGGAVVRYGVRDGCLVRWVNTASAAAGSRQVVLRPAAGAVRLGSGALADALEPLRLASNGSLLEFDLDADLVCEEAPQVVARDVVPADLPAGSGEGSFHIVRGGRDEGVDQGLGGLPITVAAPLAGDPVAAWASRDAPASHAVPAGIRERIVVPRGPLGWLFAWSMPLAHRVFYGPVAEALDLRPGDRLLDVACGGGTFLQEFAADVDHVAGLDLSELQIRFAQRRLQERVTLGTAEFVVGEATALPWDDASFTAVTCMGSLEWFDDPGAALSEMHRVLRPGGRLVLGLGPLAEPGALADRASLTFGMSVWTEAQVRTMLAEAGFDDAGITGAGEVTVVRTGRSAP